MLDQIKHFPDVERVGQLQSQTVDILKILHNALNEIATCENSADNGEALRATAVAALMEANEKAEELQPLF